MKPYSRNIRSHIKQIIFLGCMFILLCSGWIARSIGIEPDIPLDGDTFSVEKPAFTIRGVFDGTTEASIESWFRGNIPFRDHLYKIAESNGLVLFSKIFKSKCSCRKKL